MSTQIIDAAQIAAMVAEKVLPTLGETLDQKAQAAVSIALRAIEQNPTSPQGGYLVATKDGNGEAVHTFADYLLAVRDADAGDGKAVKRLREHYGVARSTKALNESDGDSGGWTVPGQINTSLMEVGANFNPIDRLGAYGPTPINMTSRTLTMPVLKQTAAPASGASAMTAGVVAYWTSESAAIQATEPSFRDVTMTAHKLTGYTAVTSELEADTVVALERLLIRLFGQAIGNNRFYSFLRGDGVGKPLGVLNAPAKIAVTRGTGADTVETADLKAMYKRMIPGGRYAWFHHPFLVENLMDLTFGSQTAFAWGNIIEGIPNRLIGAPLFPAEFLSAPGTAGDLLLADFTYYMVGERAATTISMSDQVRWLNDEKAWKFVHRVDGQPWLDNAITLSDGAGTNTVSPFIYLS